MSRRKITLAFSGASGAQYGLRLLQALLGADCEVALLVSAAARVVINTETELSLAEDLDTQRQQFLSYTQADDAQLKLYAQDDWFAPVASGTAAARAMVICPASGGTLSAIACGASNNLIERAADVTLKERRQLIVVPREAPLSTIHLRNMLTLSELGATVLPASPGFYQNPQCIEDLIDFVVARILDQLGLAQDLLPPWGEG